MVVALMADTIGLRPDDAFRGRTEAAVREEAKAAGLAVEVLAARLRADAVARQSLVNRITVQESSFFRDPGQFEALQNVVLPALADAGVTSVRLWSAGCANGQEPYSLAMVLEECGVAGEVVATDVSTQALSTARRAVYTTSELRGLDGDRRARFLRRTDEDGRWQVTDEVRARVRFSHHNLLLPPPPFGATSSHVVFCRNVVIYFDPATVRQVVGRIADLLPDDGWLFLGYSETLFDVPTALRLTPLGGAFAYRRPSTPRPAPMPEAVGRNDLAGTTDGEGGGPRADGGDRRTREELGTAGRAALLAGAPALAVTFFRRAVYLRPDDPSTHVDLAGALRAVGDLREATRSLDAGRAAIARLPSSADFVTGDGRNVADLNRDIAAASPMR